jgi:hypothetical protein
MNWKEYFEKTRGKGFLATAGPNGEVNIAVYSRPHATDDDTLAFGMTDRLTHANLQENPHAVYAFNPKGFEGVRLYLEKVREETEGPLLEEIRKRADEVVRPGTGDLLNHVVYFRVRKNLPLVGT